MISARRGRLGRGTEFGGISQGFVKLIMHLDLAYSVLCYNLVLFFTFLFIAGCSIALVER